MKKDYIAEHTEIDGPRTFTRRYYVREGNLYYNLFSPYSNGTLEQVDIWNSSVVALVKGMCFLNPYSLVILNQSLVDRYLMAEELAK